MEKLSKALFSMRMMALAMLIFLLAIGAATIIESKYDIQTAKIIIYNARWFEILLVYLVFNLIANIVRYRMFTREKMAMLAFHLSFIIIILGAGITRYFGFEGLMLIREGTSSNFIYASDPHFWFKINDGKMQMTDSKKMFMSEQTNNYFSIPLDFPGHKNPITIEYVDFKKKQIDTLQIDPSIKTGVLDIVTEGKKSNYVGPDGFLMLGDIAISYEKKNAMPGVEIFKKGSDFQLRTKIPMKYLPMAEMVKIRQSGGDVPDSMYREIPTDSLVPFYTTTLYFVGGQQFVFSREIPNAKMTRMYSGKKDVGLDVLTVKITDGSEIKLIDLEGGMSAIPGRNTFEFNGLVYELEYGSTQIQLPFSVACRDFQLEKYPGSEVASSFASEVTVIDPKNKKNLDKRIFMNNVMDYGGFRFFQSSYDLDDPNTPENEEGTRLSVNYDFWGTNVTYVGYLLMTIGMVLSLFAPVGRFKELLAKITASNNRRDASLTLAILFSLGTFSATFAQDDHAGHDHSGHDHEMHDHSDHEGHDHSSHENHAHESHSKKEPIRLNLEHYFVNKDHSDALAELLVQDFDGRIVPFHTVADQLLRKLYGKQTFNSNDAVQTVMSMHMYPEYWITQKVIAVPKAVRERLKLKEYASFQDLNDAETNEFKWLNEYNQAHQKLESKRSEFDKKLIKLVEKNQVLNSVLTWQYFKILPVRGDAGNMWISPLNGGINPVDSLIIRTTFGYLNSIHLASKENKNWGTALDNLNTIKAFQQEVGAEVVPSKGKVKAEIAYNKRNVFKNSMYLYLLLAVFLSFLFFVRIFVNPTRKSEKIFKLISIPFIVILAVTFVYHGYGLGMRWYISGHAPWSNGYEAVVFIAWVTMIAGFLFSRKNPAVLAGTAVLAFFLIFVTEMNLMDPEITPLQPVLKSYWLMIHVAIITGSYGFLGLGAILGLFNLILYTFRLKSIGKRLTAHINEITYISEMTITIGLFMLTIGTFLGGIWANESWGRYWGWDPKETWALVSVLVYAVLLHLRYIPTLNGKFVFNVISFWAFTSIIFTFFGVNFYLTGLHSYAQGDELAVVPDWIFWTVFGFYVFTELATAQYLIYKKGTEFNVLRTFIRKALITIGVILILSILHQLVIEVQFTAAISLKYVEIAMYILLVQFLFSVYSFIRVTRLKKSTIELN